MSDDSILLSCAKSIFLTKIDATKYYLSISNAEKIYLSKSDASTIYLKKKHSIYFIC
jgi:hypothetical protein